MKNGVWRTISGRRVFIKEGESLSSAMKRSGKFKLKGKSLDQQNEEREQFTKNIRDNATNYHKEMKENPDNIEEITKKFRQNDNKLTEEYKGKANEFREKQPYVMQKASFVEKDYVNNTNEYELKKAQFESNSKNNTIPKDFEKGYGKFKVKTSASDNLDDRYEITKDEYGQYHAKNLRTGESYATFANHLRNGEVFEFENNNVKTTEKFSKDYWKKQGVKMLNNAPSGWQKVNGATTAPRGYSWYSNGESLFGGKRKHALVRDK